MSDFDLAIIGVGAVGSAALLAAARAGARVIGIDRFHPPHTMGSTHGETRIVRAAIGEGVVYTPFAQRSFALWDQLARETGAQLVNRCGLLVLGGVLPHATHVAAGFLETTIEAARRFDIAHEVIGADEVRRRFPAYAAFDGDAAYFEPGAGYGIPEKMVETQIKAARAHGAEVQFSNPVSRVVEAGGHHEVTTAQGVLRARKVIICAGAWMNTFLPPAWQAQLTVTRQTLHWFDVGAQAPAFSPARMPVFIWDDLYGFPQVAQGGGAKIATELLSDLFDPANPDRSVRPSDVAHAEPKVRAHFPQLGRHLRSAVCLYTSTPRFDFLVDAHPDMPGVTLVSACSGHGFKHSAAVGEAVALAALGNAHLEIPDAFRAARALSV
ncbi:MAG TPA: N-methyl-L-tryptophan oxidase [Micropepsaceae bacterium]|nr:N-methyl-L-tryptophan oxidase [Micropepsaceae bacterium]